MITVGISVFEGLLGLYRLNSMTATLAAAPSDKGLPLARIGENRSALGILRLNMKGKPGLWVIQKAF